MKRALLFAALTVVFAPLVFGATISFDRVTTYIDGSAIAPAKIPTIQYRGYYGPAPTGPWTAGATVTDNVAITAPDPIPDPPPGNTIWYTVSAILDGQESAKAVPDSKTATIMTPAAPPGCKVR
jgi:hypothetical protein